MRFALLVQAGPDEDVVEHAGLALDTPHCSALDEACRDRVQLAPALQAAVSLDDRVKQIVHRSAS